MLLAIVAGSYALIAGAAANDASGQLYQSADTYQYTGTSSDDPFEFTASDRRVLGGGLDEFGDASTEAGVVLVGVGLTGLLLALGMAQGSKACLFLTSLWMIGGAIWIVVQAADAAPGSDGWLVAAPMLAPPVIAVLALSRERSLAVFRSP